MHDVPAHAVRRLTTLAGLAVAVVAARSAEAQPAQTGAVAGAVTSPSGPVGGARVEAYTFDARAAGGSASGAANTGEDGRYRIANLHAGRYALVTARIGYRPHVDTVNVSAAQTSTVNVSLVVAPSQLDQVITTASRAPEKVLDAPASVSVVDQRAIERRPAISLTDHLRSTPGLQISTAGIVQSNIVARGFNNAFSGSLLTLRDYRFAAVPSLRVNSPVLVPGTDEDVERIEVVLGPASALYGPNSSNGVLHVITKSPFTSQGTILTLDGGERSILRGAGRYATLLGDKAAFKVSGEYFTGKDFEYHDPGEPTVFPSSAPASRRGLPNNRDFDVNKASGEARLDLRPTENTEAVTTFGYSHVGSAIEITGNNGAAQVKNWNYATVQQRVRYKRLFAQAFVNASDAGNKDSLDTRGTYLLRTGNPIVDQSRVFAAQVQHGIDFAGEREKLVYGADYIYTNPRTGGTINGRNENVDNVTETGAYLQSTTKLAPKFDLLLAGRVDKNDQVTGTQFSPRAALVFKPAPNHNFRATFNRAFSTPANFSFFLDLPQGTNLGGSGFNVRARGNPPKQGWQFNRTCDANVSGGLCMRSQLAGGGDWVPATAASALPGFLGVQATAVTTSLTQSFQAAGLPAAQAAAQAAQIVGFLRTLRPTAAQVGTQLRFLTDPATTNRSPSEFQNIDPLTASYNQTYELGYKGVMGNRFRLAVDLWHERRGDVGTPGSLATPNVFLDPTSLNAYLTANLTGALQASGLPAQVAQAQAAQIAGSLASSFARAPLGLVTFANGSTNATDIIATYSNVKGKHLDLNGVDMAFDVVVTDALTVSGLYDWVSKKVFDEVRGADGRPTMLNAPDDRAALTATYLPPTEAGWGGEARVRYTNAFPVNSGVLASGIAFPLPGVANQTYSYASVPTATLVDLGVSYRFFVGAQKVTWSINGTNILDHKVPTFAGTAPIGRVVLTRLQYAF